MYIYILLYNIIYIYIYYIYIYYIYITYQWTILGTHEKSRAAPRGWSTSQRCDCSPRSSRLLKAERHMEVWNNIGEIMGHLGEIHGKYIYVGNIYGKYIELWMNYRKLWRNIWDIWSKNQCEYMGNFWQSMALEVSKSSQSWMTWWCPILGNLHMVEAVEVTLWLI